MKNRTIAYLGFFLVIFTSCHSIQENEETIILSKLVPPITVKNICVSQDNKETVVLLRDGAGHLHIFQHSRIPEMVAINYKKGDTLSVKP